MFGILGPLPTGGFEGVFGIAKPIPRGFVFSFRWRSTDSLSILDCHKESFGGFRMHRVHFGIHSFRIRVAFMATVFKYSRTDIKRLGCWWSSCYKQYIRVLKH